jgi:hypothetical protein
MRSWGLPPAACRLLPASRLARIARMGRIQGWLLAWAVVLAGFAAVRALSEPRNNFRFCVLATVLATLGWGFMKGSGTRDQAHPDFVINVAIPSRNGTMLGRAEAVVGADLSDDQMDFSRATSRLIRIAIQSSCSFHKPFWLIPVKFRSTRFPLHQLISKCGVGYVISGHGHQVCALG